MKSQFSLGTRLSLALSLAIASCLVANVARAESQQSTRTSVDNLSQTIAKLIDLDPAKQDLIASALNRAIASKEIAPPTPQPVVTAGVPVAPRTDEQSWTKNGLIQKPQPKLRPIINGRYQNPQPNPSPIINGRIRNPQPNPSPLINGTIAKPQQ
jgi:hypothetical protein